MKKAIYPGWWQVAVVLVIQAVGAASIFTAYSIVVAPLNTEFQPSHATLMMGIMVVALLSGIISPLLGAAIDRFSLKHLMALGGTMLGLGFAALSFSTAMTQVIIIYAVFMSVAAVLLGPLSSSALLARWFNRRRGMAMGIAASGGAVGGLLLPPLLQLLIDGFEWRIALRIYAAIAFIVTAPVVLLLVANRPEDRNIEPEAPADASVSQVIPDQIMTTEFNVKQLFLQPRFWIISLVLGSLFCGPMGVVSNMVQFVGTKGIDASQAALLLAIFSGTNFAGKLLVASFIDRMHLRIVIAAMLFFTALSMLGFIFAGSFALLVGIVMLTGLATGGDVPMWSLLVSRIYGPQCIGKVMGIMTVIIMPFTMLAPPIFGWVFDMTHSYANALFGVFALLICSLLLLTQLNINSKFESVVALDGDAA